MWKNTISWSVSFQCLYTSNIIPPMIYITWFRSSTTITSRYSIRSSICLTLKGGSNILNTTSTYFNFDVTFITPVFAPRIFDFPVINAIFSTPSSYNNSMVDFNFWCMGSTRYNTKLNYYYTEYLEIWLILTKAESSMSFLR